MIDQRNIPEGQVPCITALGPSERPRPHANFGTYPGTMSDFLRFRTASYYGFTVRDPHRPIFSTGSTS